MQLVKLSRDVDGDNPTPVPIMIYLDHETIEALGTSFVAGSRVRVEGVAQVVEKSEYAAPAGEDEARMCVRLVLEAMAVSKPLAKSPAKAMYPDLD